MSENKQAVVRPDETRGVVTDIVVGVAAGIGANLGTDGVKAVGWAIVGHLKGDSETKN
jgi:hypothetical protein